MNTGKLVLTRKMGQRVMIGDNIFVEVLKINNGTVSLGFHAPKEIPVNREEIHYQIQEQKNSVD
jgi:carbon storage regulator